MEKLKIVKIYRSRKDKQGNPFKTKDGREYERVGIKVDKYADRWVSLFGNKTTDAWKEGDEIEIEVTQNGEYLNGKVPPRNVSRDEFDALVSRVSSLEALIIKCDNVPDENESCIPF